MAPSPVLALLAASVLIFYFRTLIVRVALTSASTLARIYTVYTLLWLCLLLGLVGERLKKIQ